MRNIGQQLDELFKIKADIKNVVESKGQSLENIPFTQYSEKIALIDGGENLDVELQQQDILLDSLEQTVNTLEDAPQTSLSKVIDGSVVFLLNDEELKGALKIHKGVASLFSNLEAIFIPNSVLTIENEAFKNCAKLDSVSLTYNSELETIGNNAFENCVLLRTFTIPPHVTTIGEFAFKGCSALWALFVLSETPPVIYKNSLPETVSVIIVPKGKLNTYIEDKNWSIYKDKLLEDEMSEGDYGL